MNLYLILYLASIIFCILVWYKIEEIYKNTSSRFFLLANISLSLWFTWYFLYFTNIGTEALLLFITKACFALSIWAVYSILFFILFFDEKKKYQSRYIIYALIFYITIFISYTTTDTIVAWLSFDQWVWVYRELPWRWIYIHALMHAIALLAIVIVWIYRYANLSWLTKMRFRNIVSASVLLITILLILQLILPIFNIWILEREIFLFFVLYIGYISFTIKRYTFDKMRYDSARIISWSIAIVIATIWWAYMEKAISIPAGLWKINEEYHFTYLVIGILIFYISNKLISEKLFWRLLWDSFLIKMKNLEKKIRNSKTVNNLDEILKIGIKEYLHIDYSKIIYIQGKDRQSSAMVKYFEKQSRNHFFINDPVFIERSKKNKYLNNFLNSIPEESFLIFPIFGEKWKVVGCYTIWPKTLWDYYTEFEIDELTWLTNWISRHIQYIETYNQLEDISRNLDRKVDEKTIEYNALISRQKEFIATLSHEIKAPLTSALLQIDNLSADIDEKRLTENGIREEVISIWENLAHTKILLSQLFTTEYLEKDQATLYPERVNIIELVLSQYHIQKKVHQHCIYTESTPRGPIYMSLDRTQFIQVLTNLFTNAAKFADPKTPEIHLDIVDDKSSITIGIEDNGQWLNGIELEDIFKKYTIGKNSIWLGIWLHLCKRIVELHHGTIQAKKWKKLSWIRVEIQIPIE